MKREICDSKQQLVNDNGGGLVTLFLNEEEVTVTERRHVGDDETEEVEVTKYAYDMIDVRVEGAVSEDNVLRAAKEYVLAQIDCHDTCQTVNSLLLNGQQVWFDRSTRTSLMRRFEAEQACGQTETKVWYEDVSFVLSIAEAVDMLNQLELYASQCYDTTAGHKAAVDALGDIEEVMNYKYTEGYPEPLVINI